MKKLTLLSCPTVDLDMLRSFVAIAETGSMTNAAKIVFRTPAAVSMQVKKLETLLDTSLLKRTSRSITLTKDGEILLSYGRKLLTLNQSLMDALLTPQLEGTIRLGLPEQLGVTDLPAILSQFKLNYPQVDLDVILGRSIEINQKFSQGEIDIGIVSSNDLMLQGGTNTRFLRSERMFWVSQKGSSLINDEMLLLSLAEPGCSWRTLALKALDSAGMPYRIAYTSDNVMGQLAAVEANLAIAAIPESLLKNRLGNIQVVNNLPKMGSIESYLLLSGTATEATLTLARYIESILAEPVSTT